MSNPLLNWDTGENKMYKVYDNRTDETLLESEDSHECVTFISKNYCKNGSDYPHIKYRKK